MSSEPHVDPRGRPLAPTQEEVDAWAARAKVWAKGGRPEDLPLVVDASKPEVMPRDVFAYFIHEGKLRAPAAAMALIERLG